MAVVHRTRFASLDLARGLVVAVMALDHVRMFFTEAGFSPTDLEQTTTAYFMTRWVTHLCAPAFFFVAGVGAGLYRRQSASTARTAGFLLSRGVWLIFLELTLLGLFWSFMPGWWWFGVIFSLGAAFVLMSGLIHLPRLVLFALAVALVLASPVLGALQPPEGGPVATAYAILYSGGVVDLGWLGQRLVLFPIVPWLAMMMAGYAAAEYLFDGQGARSRRLLLSGCLLLAGFVTARLAVLIQAGSTDGRSVLAFLNVEKYPPSLEFTLCMLGLLLVTLAALARFDRSGRTPPWLSPLAAYGGAPFLFYLAHILLIHGAAWSVARLLGWDTSYLVWTNPWPNLQPPDGYGFGLPGVYLVWLVVLTALYPLCRWFVGVKRRSDAGWLRYL